MAPFVLEDNGSLLPLSLKTVDSEAVCRRHSLHSLHNESNSHAQTRYSVMLIRSHGKDPDS